MNILLLSQFFSTTRGGGEYVFSTIAQKLGENDHKVWVITNKIFGEDYKSRPNVKIIFVPPNLEYKGGLPPSFSDNLRYTFNSFFQGLKLVKKEKIDLIHSNNFSPALTGSLLSFFTSKPHITSIWDVFTLCGKNYWSKWAKQKDVSKIHAFLGPRFEKFILKIHSNAIHTISQATKEDLIKFGSKKPVHVIFPSIYYDDVKKTESNPFQFVCIGRLVFYKNLEVVIKAIRIAKKSVPKIKLIILGDGPQKKILENLVNELELNQNVEFKGFVTTEEKEELIAKSNALLFPSKCEGFGLVILEAFEQKKPVLVSNIRPMSDIISHRETGFVLEPDKENEWSNALLELISDFEFSAKMGSNGRKVLEEKFNVEDMYKKIIKMYENVL